MAFLNYIKSKLSPAKVTNPETNRDLGKGPVYMHNMSAEQIKQGLLEQNSLSAMQQANAPKKDAHLETIHRGQFRKQ
jgi:hypothetical protein